MLLVIKIVVGLHTLITVHFYIICLATVHTVHSLSTANIPIFPQQNVCHATHGVLHTPMMQDPKILHLGAQNPLWALMVQQSPMVLILKEAWHPLMTDFQITLLICIHDNQLLISLSRFFSLRICAI